MPSNKPRRTGHFVLLVLALCGAPAAAQVRNRTIGPGVVALPYTLADNAGNSWNVTRGGMFQQQGNQPIYSQSSMITINGNAVQNNVNSARLEEKTGEIVIENLAIQGFIVTRRIKMMQAEGALRYVDIVKNPSPQEQSVNMQITTNLNYGVNAATFATDARKKELNVAWIAMTGANRAAVDVFAGPNPKFAPTMTWQQGSNVLQASVQLAIPAGKEVAIVHFHATAATQDQGTQLANTLRDTKLLSDLPAAVRRAVINFGPRGIYAGDLDILRGETLDVVELRGGDQMNGTLKETGWKVETFYGSVDLPIERVVAVINVGQFKPRTLLITTEGEVFGGKLERQALAMELSSGQRVEVPLSQVKRVGYRKRPTEPEEIAFTKPIITLGTGERMAIEPLATPIEVATRYGQIKLPSTTISAIDFQPDDQGLNQVYLSDGSRFVGLVLGEQISAKLAGAGESTVNIPISSMRQMQFTAELPDVDPQLATVALANGDSLVGSLSGQFKLDTAFDTLTIDAGQIRSLSRPATANSGLDVQVTLWDQTTVTGQLQVPSVMVKLGSGIEMKVPIALIQKYDQPVPEPSAPMAEQIKTIVGELSAEDWRQRDRAEAQLLKMGPAVIGVLKKMSDTVPPEAQQRIESILKQLEKKE